MRKLVIAFLCIAFAAGAQINPEINKQKGSIGAFVPMPFVDITWHLEDRPSLLEAGAYFE